MGTGGDRPGLRGKDPGRVEAESDSSLETHIAQLNQKEQGQEGWQRRNTFREPPGPRGPEASSSQRKIKTQAEEDSEIVISWFHYTNKETEAHCRSSGPKVLQ